VEHLLELGHRDVAIVMGGSGPASDRARLQGFVTTLEEHGLTIPPEYVASGTDTFEGGREATAGLLDLSRRPSAILATNNLMTIGAMVAVTDAGLTVPADISVVGIDDMEWYPIARPAISAVHESASEMGRYAAERLLLRLRRKRQPSPARIRLETEFRVRESTGPPSPEARRSRGGEAP
jgi:LacI family transcriptional regulator